ncbi:hypothetical protein F4804DRAFT_351184 [Jackrogersella minutella]|nr:hypothetical protein F4804DRAFT_351184 [Jackrogersella minutella]
MASKMFRKGTKQVFLPDHTIAFLRPRENQPPNFATFRVPLTFNKLDLRDYLLHAYNVPVLGVRSQLSQRLPRRSKMHGRIYRPPPVKTMTAQLRQPFVFPKEPEDKAPWNPPQMAARMKLHETREKMQKKAQKAGTFPMRDELPPEPERKQLRKEAQKFLLEGGWDNERTLDPKFTQGRKKDEDDK